MDSVPGPRLAEGRQVGLGEVSGSQRERRRRITEARQRSARGTERDVAATQTCRLVAQVVCSSAQHLHIFELERSKKRWWQSAKRRSTRRKQASPPQKLPDGSERRKGTCKYCCSFPVRRGREMSARVFNPLYTTEISRMLRGGGGAGNAPAAASSGCGGEAASAPVGGGGFPREAAAGVARVRRQLFGPVDHEETRRFVQRELQAMRRRDAEHYGFDFEREAPIPGGRLVWEKVEAAAASVPAPYALRRLPYLAAHSDGDAAAATPADAGSPSEDAEDAAPAPAATSAETTPVAAAVRATSNNNNNNTVAASTPKQTCISDFLKIRKRTTSSTGTKTSKLTQEEPSVKQVKKTHS